MIDKIKAILSIALIVIVIFAVGYSLVNVVKELFEEPVIITLDNIEQCISEESIVTSYSVYYYYEECMNNVFEACEGEMYNGLYEIYIDDYEKVQGKEKITNELKLINKMLTPKSMDEIIEYKLDKLYVYEDSYIAKTHINDNIIYILFSEGVSKSLDYTFAVIQ